MAFGTQLMTMQVLLPHIWPAGIRQLQLRAAGLALCFISVACLNVMIPRQVGIVIDTCIAPGATRAWASIFILAILCLATSTSGLGLVREWLWIPLHAHFAETMICRAYSHILHLSADFHDSRSTPHTSQVILAVNGVSNLIESVLLRAIPALLDIVVAVIYLSVTLGSFQGLVTAAVGIALFLLTSRFIRMAAPQSRLRKEALNNEVSIRHRALIIWHVSDAVDQLGYEDNHHADIVAARQDKDMSYKLFWVASVAIETGIIFAGLVISSILAFRHVRTKQVTPGQFMMLLTYWSQLAMSLISLAKQGGNASDDLTDAENFIEVMKTTPIIKKQGNERPRPLKSRKGDVEFDQVYFKYRHQAPVIKNASLRVSAGQTVALVGPHGAGKSTLLKLLRRSYDATRGHIKIDDQDIRDVDVHSLRDSIGFVPPFPVLFNDTIMNNIRYGRITASNEDVYGACKAACIHQRILSFSQGYDTKVGEHGMKLSAGEIQLIAVARAILKNPSILVLDGATSALDEDTEEQLRASLITRFQGLTKFVVSSRPATIMKADVIIVVEDGQILERGTHDQLSHAGGKYADMSSG